MCMIILSSNSTLTKLMYVKRNYDNIHVLSFFFEFRNPSNLTHANVAVQETEELLTVVMILLQCYMEIVSANADHSFDSAWNQS